MVIRLQALLSADRLHLPKRNRQAETMRRELMRYEIRVNAHANIEAGAFRTGAHDDLVTAVGLACLIDPPADASHRPQRHLAMKVRALHVLEVAHTGEPSGPTGQHPRFILTSAAA